MRNLTRPIGSAMTEFVFFLPVWVIMMVGVVNLGQLGVNTTKVQLQAQRSLWADVIEASNSSVDTYSFPLSAAGDEASNLETLNVEANPQQFVDVAEIGTHSVALGAAGHWGESYQRTLVIQSLSDDMDDITADPDDILGEEPQFPHLLLSDSATDHVTNLSDSEGIGDILGSIIGASGFTQSMLAGIRYGVVFSGESSEVTLVGGAGTSTAHAHYDILVGPKGPTEPLITFGGSFLLVQTVEEYRVMQRFGDSEWDRGNSAPADSQVDTDDVLDDAQDQADQGVEERCAELEAQLEEGETLPEECL